MEEKELVKRAKQGDVNAFCFLYDQYKSKLFNYAFYRLGNSFDAEDVVQDTVLTAYEQIHKLKKEDAFSSWIFKILYYGCIDYAKNQIKRKDEDNIDDYENVILCKDSNKIDCLELQQALNILKEDEKNVVLLSVVSGFNSKEIAKITGFSSANVRQKLKRSLAKMKKYFLKKECL